MKARKPNKRTIGRITGYKKVRITNSFGTTATYVLQLEILAKTPRVFPKGANKKARCARARVVRAWKVWTKDIGGGVLIRTLEVCDDLTEFKHDPYAGPRRKFVYKLGEVADDSARYDNKKSRTCSSGINFFLSKKAATNYH